MMKRLCLLLTLCCGTSQAAADLFKLPGYQDEDGAILLQAHGRHVDPYFAMKALLTAEELGLSIAPAADAWTAWLAPRQESNGSFPRFERQTNGDWRRAADADADDSTLALWISLLSRRYRQQDMPPALQASLARARRALWKLRQPRSGIYDYAAGAKLGYLMDNVEVYAALRDDCARTGAGCRRVRQLAAALPKAFWEAKTRRWRTASRDLPPVAFYPEAAAQLFPKMVGLPPMPGQASFDAWLLGEGRPWLAQDPPQLDFPWGLLALAALRDGREDAARAWLRQAAPARGTPRWNVLEEAVFQGLALRLAATAEPEQRLEE
ncbi:hypothetical protein JW897_04160 [Chromobacterium alkanivorans]|uniref:hypothetical protein n=1 Tax=Chromobacterium alkanivorans TaxID=1071719 RepID=UPI001967AE1C|nr:hypothetical protein [Chromobacterium alkanivorans]MBN3002924.1 hypothetical protein [Chromobacterium alkanivorans]